MRLYLAMIALIFILFSSNSQALNLNEYRKQYLAEDEVLATKMFQMKLAEENFNVARDLYQSTLELGPTTGDSETKTESTSTSDSYGEFNWSWQQNLASGTSITLNSKELYEKPKSTITRTDKEISVSISQELWRNAFGSADRKNRLEKELLWQEKQKLYNQELLNSCKRSINIYEKAYALQSQLKILDEMKTQSNEALRISERSFKKRIIRKIDVLSARSDFLQMEARHKEAELKLTKALQELALQANLTQRLDLLSALDDNWLTQLNFEGTGEINSLELKAAGDKVLASMAQEESAQLDNRLGMTFGLVGRKSEGISASETGFGEFETEFAGLSLTMEWPVINRSLSAREKQAQYNRMIAEKNLSRAKKEFNIDFSNTKNESEALEKLIQLSKEKSALYTSQIKEANRLLRSGKILFENYLSYRDADLNEKLNLLSLHERWVNAKTKLASFSANKSWMCGEI